jgi:hypothetical protein
MSNSTTAVALAVRVHPGGGPPSGDRGAVIALRDAAATAAARDAGLLSGPSSITPDGVLLLPLSDPGAVLDAILAVADALRPMRATFCGAVGGGGGTDGAGHVESALIATEAASSMALRGIETTDAKERRVCLLTPDPDPVAAALAGMVLASYDGMTERQRQIVALTKDSETQQQVATHLDVTRQAVNQSLSAAGWPHLRRAEEAMRAHLSPGSRRAARARRTAGG